MLATKNTFKLLILLTVVFSEYLNAQSYHFKNYKEYGFSNNQIFAVHQDSYGFLWFGTGVGLARFDSDKFLTFSVNNGLPANEILSLSSNDDSLLWVGTGLGLAIFDISDINNPHFLFTPPGLANYSISSLCYFKNQLWIGTRRNGLFLMTYHSPDKYDVLNLVKSVSVKEIRANSDNKIMVLFENALTTFDQKGEPLTQIKINSKHRLKCFIQTQENNYWIGTDSGIINVNDSLIEGSGTTPQNADSLDFNTFLFDSRGTLWAGADKGLVKFNSEKAVLINRSSGLPGLDLRALLFDSEGNMWLGSYTSGLFKLNNTNLINYTEEDGLLSNVVNCILTESDNRKLVGTDLGVFKIENFKLSRDKRFDELNNEIIWFIYRDHRKNLWIGGENILYQYADKKLKKIDLEPVNDECTFLDMLQGSDGTYWFGTTIGLFSVNGPNQKSYPVFAEKGIRSVWEVEELADGRILFGTDNGVAELFENEFRFITNMTGLPDRAVYTIKQDSNGNVWMGSDLGIIKAHNAEYSLIGSRDGLAGTIISQVLIDKRGNIWICSDKGLQKLENNIPGKRYGLNDGLVGEEFTTQNSSLVDKNGNFWLGVFGGLTVFDPEKLNKENIKPRLYFARAGYQESGRLKSFINQDEVSLDYSSRNITFTILGLYFYNEDDLTFSYKLSGFDEDWQVAERNENIRYNNLSPGKYKFAVRALIDGQPEGEILYKGFEIRTPFWQESWFILLTFVLLTFMVYIIFRYKTKRILKVNRELQSQIDKNVKDLALAQATIENIVEHSGSVLITTDLKGRIVTWNKRAEDVFGYKKADVLHKNIKILDQQNDLWDFGSIIQEVKKSGELRQLEVKKTIADGSLADLIMTITALKDGDQKVHLINFSMEDFSERNRLVELRVNRERLLAGIEALNKLLATLSHYINNSTASISGMAQLVELDVSYGPKFLAVTHTQIKKIQAVIKSLGELVNRLNLKTKDYVGEKDLMYDIESDIETFIESVEKIKNKKEMD